MDYYSVLGVNKDATQDQIKKAYRKLASQHHPDKGGDTQKFQEIQTAYDTLSDPQKRNLYDNPRPQFQGMPGGFSFTHGPDINDIFAQMFGQQSPFGQRGQKPTYRTRVSVTLQECYNGAEKFLTLQTTTNTNSVKISVPKGIMSGQQLRYENLIENGTLLVEYVVLPDLKFDRADHNLICSVPINVLDLIIGTSFEFTTISGKTLNVNVKPKTQPYVQLKLTGQGMPILNSNQYGDQIILLKPFIPDNIDESIISAIENVNTINNLYKEKYAK